VLKRRCGIIRYHGHCANTFVTVSLQSLRIACQCRREDPYIQRWSRIATRLLGALACSSCGLDFLFLAQIYQPRHDEEVRLFVAASGR
jgi:uncharacterized membrane protein SirB2